MDILLVNIAAAGRRGWRRARRWGDRPVERSTARPPGCAGAPGSYLPQSVDPEPGVLVRKRQLQSRFGDEVVEVELAREGAGVLGGELGKIADGAGAREYAHRDITRIHADGGVFYFL